VATYSTASGLDGTTITLPSSETVPTGYSAFDGWATSSGATSITTGDGPGASYTLAGAATLYAVFTPNGSDTITFKNNAGVATYSTASGLDGTTITLPSSDTDPTGYNAGDGPGASYTLAGAATLYAVFTPNGSDTITFKNNAGVATYSTASGLDGTTI